MPDRLTGMEVFARIAAAGSFRKAAAQLGMSAAMATKHVDALERRLGLKLLFRTTRRLTLTEAGRAYLESCLRILPAVAEAEAMLTAERIDISGRLRITAPVSFGTRQLTPLLGSFLAEHPHLVVELGLNDRTVDLVEEGWDMAVRIGHLGDSRLTARKLAPCRVVLCAAPAYLAARGHPATVADLAGHACLGYTLSHSIPAGEWRFGPRGTVAVPVSGPLIANNGDALLTAAIAGLGIIYQPSFLVADALADGRLVELVLDQPDTALAGVFALHPHERHPPAKVRAMIDFLAGRFGPHPPWDRSWPDKQSVDSADARP